MAELDTDQHRFELHAVWILYASAILKSPPQILLTRLGNTCQLRAAANQHLDQQILKTESDWL